MNSERANSRNRLLLVDDEPNVIKALSRVLQPLKCELITASSGKGALRAIQDKEINLVLTDMRMPKMDGTQLLAHVAEQQPDARRLILTGFADLPQTITSINEGKVHRFLTKPWDNEELRSAISDEIQISSETLRARTEQASLAEKSITLESKAAVTSSILGRSVDLIKHAKYQSALEIYTQLTNFRYPRLKDYTQSVTHRARIIGAALNLAEPNLEDLHTAACLHLLGLVLLPHKFSCRSINDMNHEELTLYRRYPLIGAQAIKGDAREDSVATIIRHHREWFNGNGFPDRLVSHYIPIESRIIHVAADYEKIKSRRGDEAAIRFMKKHATTRYDPAIVDILACPAN